MGRSNISKNIEKEKFSQDSERGQTGKRESQRQRPVLWHNGSSLHL